jgi:trimeric autotransporter adhesin
MENASEALFALKPVCFRYKKEIDPVGISQLGLVAEDVVKVNPDLVVRDAEGKPYTVRYDQVNAMLLNEFLKEHSTVQELKKEIATLTATVKEQSAQIQKVSAQLAAASPSRGGLEASKTAPQIVNNP